MPTSAPSQTFADLFDALNKCYEAGVSDEPFCWGWHSFVGFAVYWCDSARWRPARLAAAAGPGAACRGRALAPTVSCAQHCARGASSARDGLATLLTRPNPPRLLSRADFAATSTRSAAAAVLTGNYSHTDRLWSITPVVYVWIWAAAAGFDARTSIMAALSLYWGARLSFNFWRKVRAGRVPSPCARASHAGRAVERREGATLTCRLRRLATPRRPPCRPAGRLLEGRGGLPLARAARAPPPQAPARMARVQRVFHRRLSALSALPHCVPRVRRLHGQGRAAQLGGCRGHRAHGGRSGA